MNDIPVDVVALAEARVAARAAKDWGQSDSLRDEIAALGYVVADGPDGYRLTPKPPFDVVATIRDLPRGIGADAACVLTVLIDGWPQDVMTCLQALRTHLRLAWWCSVWIWAMSMAPDAHFTNSLLRIQISL